MSFFIRCVHSGISYGSILDGCTPISYSARLGRLNFFWGHSYVAIERLYFQFHRRTDLISSAFLRSLECACPSLQLSFFLLLALCLINYHRHYDFVEQFSFFRLQVVHWNCWLQKRQHCVFCKCGGMSEES
jgi:hypothetical protein